MKLIIKIEKEDVNAFRLGRNVAIKTQLIDIVFSPEALEELIEDYGVIKLSELPAQE